MATHIAYELPGCYSAHQEGICWSRYKDTLSMKADDMTATPSQPLKADASQVTRTMAQRNESQPRPPVPAQTIGDYVADDPRLTCRQVNVHYGSHHAIREVTIDIARNQVIAMIGPSGCGKSTFLRCLNRMNDTIEGCRVSGRIEMDGRNIPD